MSNFFMRSHHASDLFGVVKAFALCIAIAFPVRLWAGSAYVYELANPTDIGTAGAGLEVKAQNAGTVFANPAGMMRFNQPELLVAGTGLYLHAPFDPNSNTTVNGSDGQTSQVFGGGQFAYIHPVTPKLNLGISAQNYFGLSLDWSSQWVGRYVTTKTTLIAPQVQPTVAYQVNDWLAVGGGTALTLGYLKDKKRVFNVDPARGDGKLNYSDSDFTVQYNLGIMIEPSERTRLGLRYLSEADLEFEDGINLSNVGPVVGQAAGTRLGLKMNMPQAVNLGAFHQLTDKWALLASVGWEDWSRFGSINVQVDSAGSSRSVKLKTRDVWHFGLGAQYQYTPVWLLSTGFSYDTGMSSDANRPIILPLGHMYRYGAGFEYEKREDLTVGAGLDFVWEGNLPVAQTGNPVAGTVDGKYEDVYFVFATVYATWRF